MRLVVVLEDAQIADPTKKIVTAARRIIFRPKISENLPHTGVDAALASRYAEPIHVNAVAECNSCMIVGVAVVAIVKSKAARNKESCEWHLQLAGISRLWKIWGLCERKERVMSLSAEFYFEQKKTLKHSENHGLELRDLTES